jgi:hypothetical protein
MKEYYMNLAGFGIDDDVIASLNEKDFRIKKKVMYGTKEPAKNIQRT